jgi:drug/metabolite transporter (DMT)-like permease
MIFRILLLIAGVFFCSTAVIFIRESSEHVILLSSYRLLVAAIALTPLFIRDYKRQAVRVLAPHIMLGVVPGILLGIHFISWIKAARMTTAVNASLIVNLSPIVMPFILFYMIRERITKRELIGTALAVAGVLVLSAADFNVSRRYFWGDVLCFGSMLFLTFYLALGRRNKHLESIWLYVVPLFYIAGIMCFFIALFFVNPIKPYSVREIALILALGIVPTVFGHSILNYSLKHMKGQIISIFIMTQFIFAGVMAYFIWRELPGLSFYFASILVLGGAVLAIERNNG